MDLLVNDLSVHEQFHDMATFRGALSRLMAMRNAAGWEIYCHRQLLNARPIPGVPMPQAIGHLGVDARRDVMRWLTRGGPFWDDLRRHGPGDYLESRKEIVTDTAVGEAGFRMMHDVDCGLVSVSPSDWDYAPVEVIWRREDEGLEDRRAALNNWRDAEALKAALQGMVPLIASWDQLRESSVIRFESLTFTEDCFAPLRGFPFVRNVAERCLVLFGILDRLARAFDETGGRTTEGHRIYQDHFTGENSWFSDSSDSEKRDFRRELTFVHPDDPGSSLSCTWHGKVRHMVLRIHFSWPIECGKPVYVVYAGPKITKR